MHAWIRRGSVRVAVAVLVAGVVSPLQPAAAAPRALVAPAAASVPEAPRLPAPAPEESADPNIFWLQFNICGAAVKSFPTSLFCYARGATDADVVKETVDRISAFEPDFVSLNEVCRNQYDHLLLRLEDEGYRMYGGFSVAVSQEPHCSDGSGDDADFGVAVLSRHFPIGEATEYALPDPQTYGDGRVETRRVVCLRTRYGKYVGEGYVNGCSTHLVTADHPDRQAHQTARLAEIIDGYVSVGEAVMVGGDFNLTPNSDALDVIYSHSGGSGTMREVDDSGDDNGCDAEEEPCRDGEASQGSEKIDYIFASEPHFTWLNGDVVGSLTSDHNPLYGVARLGLSGTTPPEGSGDGPRVSAGPDLSIMENEVAELGGSVTGDGTPTATWSYAPSGGVDAGTECFFGDAHSPVTTFTCDDDGTFTITLTADDVVHPPVSDVARVRVRNAAPVLDLVGPRPWQVFRARTPVDVVATFTDAGVNDTHTCTVDWDDPTKTDSFPAVSGGCDRSHSFRHAGMYTIRVKVTDDDGASDSKRVMIVVYDPEAEFANVDGSVTSPAGARRGDDGAAGELWFNLSARYYGGDATVPVGTLKGWLAGTDLRFEGGATGLQWLVVNEDRAVVVRATGTLQGGSGRYGMLLYGRPGGMLGLGSARVVIWSLADGENPDDSPLYDSRRGQGYDVDEVTLAGLTSGTVTVHPPT